MRAAMILVMCVMFAACGSKQSADSEPAATNGQPAATNAQPAQAALAPTQTRRDTSRDHLIWIVYWDEIHTLTIYPQAGPVSSEERGNGNATFSSTNPHFSVISEYFEKEDDFAPVIEAATGVDDLLRRLAEDPMVRIEELVNPVYAQ